MMKKLIYILLVPLLVLGVVAVTPIMRARANCAEVSLDVWICDTSVPNPDPNGMDAGANSDTVTVDSLATVSNVGNVSAISMTDGTLTNNGTISNNDSSGSGVFALGNADITNNGTVSANGNSGAGVYTDTGDVTNNGIISASGSSGVAITTDTGDNTVTLGAGSTTTGDTVAVQTGAGDDTVTIGNNATVIGTIDGEANADILQFTFLTQADLGGYAAAGGTLTYGNQTYTWLNFEQLVGLLMQIAQASGGGYSGPHVWFDSGLALGLTSQDARGIDVFAAPGKIAFIPFADLALITTGDRSGVRFQLPNRGGWFIRVFNLGHYHVNPELDWYQVNVYSGDGTLLGDEQGFGYKP